MEAVFFELLNRSLMAGWLVLVVLLVRLLLKDAPKYWRCLLWGLVAIRLVCPFSLTSVLSLIPSREPIAPSVILDAQPFIDSGIASLDSVVNSLITRWFIPEPCYSANPLQIFSAVAAVVWLVGVVIMLGMAAASYFRLRCRIRPSLHLQDNLYLCDNLCSPFILGVFRPRIYLPSETPESERSFIVAHEQVHLKRCDQLWKPIGFLLLSVFWFHPLLWLAYALLCRDIESACDEKVICDMTGEQRADYSQALLNHSVSRRLVTACPLAFGETGVRQRIKEILNYRKPAFWLILISAVACVAVAVCFLTDPVSPSVSCSRLTVTSTAATEDVSLSISDYDLNAEKPFICIRWDNGGDEEIAIGSSFHIDRLTGEGVYTPCLTSSELIFNDLGYSIPAHGYREMIYSVKDFDLSRCASYRLFLNSLADSQYLIDFMLARP